MTKFLCYGDMHLREFGSFQPYNKVDEVNGLTKELNNIMLGSEFVASVIRMEKPDVVFDLGDFFHDKNSISSKTLFAASICANNIRRACDDVNAKCFMLAGNHNFSNEANNVTNCDILDGYFTVLKSPTILDYDIKVGVIPYSSKVELVKETLNQYKKECDLIITHLEFKGCVYDSGSVSVNGYDPDLGIPCVSGHIHTLQSVKDVIYPGSVVQNTFSTYNLDQVGGALTFKDNDLSSYTHHQNFRSKHYVKVTSLNYLFKNLDSLLNKAVLKIMVPKEMYDKGESLVSNFEHVFIPTECVNDKRDVDIKVDGDGEDHVVMLRNYVMDKLPTSLDLFDKILGFA